jgi:formylglycine-generating enzyme required for sulfatase activity
VNDGVEETPPPRGQLTAGEKSSENDDLFIDLTKANVGFNHWYPTAVTAHGNRLAGQAEMGGVWEWTSSPLSKHEGFEPMALYPAYTGTLQTLLVLSSQLSEQCWLLTPKSNYSGLL